MLGGTHTAIPLEGAKRASKAANALTGDIYVRRWTTVVGKGKKKREVEKELHVNPLMLIGTAVAGGVAVAGAAVGLWLTQRKVGKAAQAENVRIMRFYEPVFEEKTVVITPETTTTVWDARGVPHTVIVPAVLGTETVMTKAGRLVVYSKRMRPLRNIVTNDAVWSEYAEEYLSAKERAIGWEHDDLRPITDMYGEDYLGKFYQRAMPIRNKSKKPLTLEQRQGMFEGWF